MFWPCETRTSTCRSFATISSGLYRFLAIAVLLDVKDIPQVGPLQWGRITSSRSHSRDGLVGSTSELAATNKSLAQSNESRTGAERLRNRTANDGYSDEKMCPMSRKTRIRCPLPQCVERSLVGSCGVLFDSLRGAS